MVFRLFNSRPDVNRVVAILMCMAAVLVCLAYAHWRSVLPEWWREFGGGIPYVVFWATFWFAIFPFRHCILPICIFATAFTCFLECMQLWKPEWLVQLCATTFGAALLGSGFTWNDFPPYLIGGAIGCVMLTLVVSCGSRPDDNP